MNIVPGDQKNPLQVFLVPTTYVLVEEYDFFIFNNIEDLTLVIMFYCIY